MLLLISEGCRNPCPVFVSAVAHSFLGPWVGTHPCTHPFHYRVVVWCLPKRCLNGVLPCRSIPSPGRATACVSAGQLYLEARRLPVNQLSNAQICHLRFLWLLAKCSANTHTHTRAHTLTVWHGTVSTLQAVWCEFAWTNDSICMYELMTAFSQATLRVHRGTFPHVTLSETHKMSPWCGSHSFPLTFIMLSFSFLPEEGLHLS